MTAPSESTPQAERRRIERRSRERRSAVRPKTREPWFRSSELGPAWPEDGSANAPPSRFGEDLSYAEGVAAPSQFDATLDTYGAASSGRSAFERIYRTFVAARAGLGLALALVLGASGLFGVWPGSALLLLSLAYAAQAIGLWLLSRPPAPARRRNTKWLATIGVDIVCFTAMHVLSPMTGLNYMALLVLPVLMAGVLVPRIAALATAAAVTLVLLGLAWLNVLAGGDAAVLLMQAGLAGSGLFVVSIMASELAARLRREERSARGSQALAQQQTELNRLVIEEMQDGVLVVDRRDRVRTANPAARALLVPEGSGPEAPFALGGTPAWSELVVAIEEAFLEAQWPEAGRDVVLDFEPGLSRTVRVRVRFVRRREGQGSEQLCALFLEDVRSVQARTRQEKLAAMGRVSAGIAHEIRNPLAAIAQANALLSEDAATAQQHQLTQMVAANVGRLKRIVDDVMEVATGAPAGPGIVDAGSLVAAVCGEWMHANSVDAGEGGVLHVDLPAEPLHVAFDADHLRRVLVNLLDNARAHASGSAGAVQLRLRGRDASEALLTLASDGQPIAPEVERYLFEPFFSTRSRGAGLGLYICRELCERHGARISYRARPASERHRNEFSIAMRRQTTGVPPPPTSV